MQRRTPSDPPRHHVHPPRHRARRTLPRTSRGSRALRAGPRRRSGSGRSRSPATARRRRGDGPDPEGLRPASTPCIASFIEEEIAAAASSDVVALVLQLDSEGAVVSDARMDEVVDRHRVLRRAGHRLDRAVGGPRPRATPCAWSRPRRSPASRPAAGSEVTAGARRRLDLAGRTAVGERAGSELAAELGLVDNDAPRARRVHRRPARRRDRTRSTTAIEPVTPVRFGQLGLIDQLFHTVASPPVAYLLLVIGASLLVFELFTAGVGVAGMVGAGSLLLAAYGLAVLPDPPVGARAARAWRSRPSPSTCRPGVPRFWTAVGVVALVVGSVALFEDGPPSWITLLAGIVGVAARHARRHAGHGPHPVLHADDRSGVDDGRDRGRPSPTSRPTASSPSAARRGGPTRTGPRPSPPATRCGSSPSTGSPSRSSPWRAARRTTARPARTDPAAARDREHRARAAFTPCADRLPVDRRLLPKLRRHHQASEALNFSTA